MRSRETPERDGAVWGGGQQYLLGVSASFPSGQRKVALPEGRKEESGKEKQSHLYKMTFLELLSCIFLPRVN